MKVTQIWKLLGILCIVSFMAVTACDKDDDNNTTEGKATMKMHLTDAPAAYDAVYIDVQEIEVHSDTGGWVTLANVKPGIYNLLDFRNGLDTLIAVGEVPSGKISQIRLILGPNNSVVENGITHSLKTPSAQQSGLKLNVNYTLQPGWFMNFGWTLMPQDLLWLREMEILVLNRLSGSLLKIPVALLKVLLIRQFQAQL